MVFSLPSYRRLSEADLHRLRNDSEQRGSARISRIAFNLLLLVGLWGLPHYLRSLVLSSPSDTIDPHEAIVGRWQDVDNSSYVLEFTRDGVVNLTQGGIVKWTAHYRFNNSDAVVLYDINPHLVIDNQKEVHAQCRYRFLFTRDSLSVTDRGWEIDAAWKGPKIGQNLFQFLILPSHFKRVQ